MSCTFANSKVSEALTIRLVDSADGVNVGERPIYMAPTDVLTYAIDATAKAGDSLCSVSDVVVTAIGTALGTLTIDASDVQRGCVLLLINGAAALANDEWSITFKIHATPITTINGAVRVKIK